MTASRGVLRKLSSVSFICISMRFITARKTSSPDLSFISVSVWLSHIRLWLLTCSCSSFHVQVWSSTGTPPLETSRVLVPTANWTLSLCTMMAAWFSTTPAPSTAACTTASCSTQTEQRCGPTSSTSVMTIRNTANMSSTAAVVRSGSGGMSGLMQRGRTSSQTGSLQELWQLQCCWHLCLASALELWAGRMFSGAFRDLTSKYWFTLGSDSPPNILLNHTAKVVSKCSKQDVNSLIQLSSAAGAFLCVLEVID